MKVSKAAVARLAEWGGPAEMGGFESVMWRAEVDPRLRSSGVSVHVLDGQPDWEQIYADHQWMVSAVPRLRQRVVEPAFNIGNPMWMEDSAFNLDYHLRRVRVAEPAGRREMLNFLQQFASTPCDRSRPPWEAMLIDGLADGTSVYALKLHHTMTDGMGVIQFFENVLSHSKEPVERPKLFAKRGQTMTPAELARRNLRRFALKAPGRFLQDSLSLTKLAVRAGRNPAQAGEYLKSAQRVLAGHGIQPSPLFRDRSLAARYDMLNLPLQALKAAGKAQDCSLNDVVVAGIVGGLQRYHEAFDIQVDSFAVGFPISLRSDDDEMGGNKFAGAQYAAPGRQKDPFARMREVRQFVREVREEPALDLTVRLMPLMNRLPLPLLTSATAKVTTSFDVQISNIPGHRNPVYIGGRQATEHYAFGPRPGSVMMIAMFSYCDRFCLGINTDPAAVKEPELFIECLQQEFDLIFAGQQAAREQRKKAS